MSLASIGNRLVTRAREVVSNRYFWGGCVGLLLIGGLLYLSVDRVLMPNYTRHGVAVEVPNVQEIDLEEARSRLESAGFRIEVEEGQYNPNFPQDLIVDQSPLPNTAVKPNRRVYLTVNRGEVPTVVLPDFAGMSSREARNRAEGRRLVVDTMRADTIPSPYPGTITRQEPAPNDTVDVGSEIKFWYSTGLGEEETTVPELVGLSVEDAREALLDRNLRPLIIQEDDDSENGEDRNEDWDEDDAPSLYVRMQGQDPDTEVPEGTEIRLFVTDDPDTIDEDAGEAIPDTLDIEDNTPTMETRLP